MERSAIPANDEHPERRLLLVLACVGTFMGTLDVSIVNVALPTLTQYFSTSVATSQWFVLAYTFSITILLLTFGKLGDIIGRRRLYVVGTLVFVAGSFTCGMSVSALMLILSRAAQGIGSAITMSAGPALITEAFSSRERGKALGFVGSSVALGLLAGPIIGGFLVEYASWRWMFFINVPTGLALAALFATRVKGFDERARHRLDIYGAVLLALSLSALVIGLSYGEKLGWTSGLELSVLGSAVALGALFIIVESRVKNPILDLRIFRNREFTLGATTGWTNYAAMMPVTVFMPFYLQNLLSYRPDQVGMILAAGPLTLAMVAPFAGIVSDRIGSRLLTSLGLLVLGSAMLLMRTLTPDSAWTEVIWRLALASLGSALFVTPNSSAIMGSVDAGELGVASGAIALVRNLGMLCGIAVAGAIILTVQNRFCVTAELHRTPEVEHYIFFMGLKEVFLVSAIVAWCGAFLSSMRVRPGDREAFDRMMAR